MDESNSESDHEEQADAAEASSAESESSQDAGAEGLADAVPAQAAAGPGIVQAPSFEDLAEAVPAASGHPSLDIVLDVPVTISLEVGKASMTVGELIRLGQGAVVELDRAVGEPLDVMVNGALVAHGEIVLVNEKFGIRLTSVISAGESMKEAG